MQKEIIAQMHAGVGEHIGFELGAKMVKDFQDAHPNDTQSVFCGRNVIEEILAQPGCVGIKMFNALTETGARTLVFVGLDERGRHILEYDAVDQHGMLIKKEGIVADRVIIRPPTDGKDGDGTTPPPTTTDTSWW